MSDLNLKIWVTTTPSLIISDNRESISAMVLDLDTSRRIKRQTSPQKIKLVEGIKGIAKVMRTL